MNETQSKNRTKQFGLDVFDLVDALPPSITSRALSDQLLRSAMSIGANYRAVCRAKSPADMMNKLAIVEEEADESACWLGLAADKGLAPLAEVHRLLREANELTAMVVASRLTISRNTQQRHSGNRTSTIENRK
jgi:four helix bundle protein